MKEAFGNSAIVDYSVLQVYDMLTKEQSPLKNNCFYQSVCHHS